MITKSYFDTYNGRQSYIYELSNDKLKVGITDFGGAIQYLKVVTPSGEKDVCLGFDNISEYINSATYCGATIGRVANRIADARYCLNGKEYVLSQNDGKNCLHGGADGFDKKFFQVKTCGDLLCLTLTSPDGDMGFGGNMQFEAQFSLEGGALNIKYSAQSDADTLWSPTCHAYFNLGGTIGEHMLKIDASKYTPAGEGLIPTGEVNAVTGTPFDFTQFKPIGRDMHAENAQLSIAGGYDHNYVLNGGHAATVYSPVSAIKLDVFTDMPGLQFYSGNFIKGRGKNGVLNMHDGFCLEPQFFPNAINIPWFQSPILKGGEQGEHFIKYSFSW